MRPRAVVLASMLAALSGTAASAVAEAAPHHNHGLTIAVTPNPIVSGDGVLIYGQLNSSDPGNKTVVLYHRINPSSAFTVVSQTTTSSTGFYEFPRAEGVVLTNRSWFVRAPGLAGNIHSRTVHERVAAEVSLNAPAPASALTGQAVVLSGVVAPNHTGESVALQEQVGASGHSWRTLKRTRLDAASRFSVSYRFKAPGGYAIRAYLRGDGRNTAAASDTQTVTVQQKQTPDFTIGSSTPIVVVGHSATISGTLSQPGTTTPEPNVMVTLWGHTAGQSYAPIKTATTIATGGYSFSVAPQHNIQYQVRTTFAPARASAPLSELVSDAVTLTAGARSSSVGQSVMLSGFVTPDKAGHAVYLERLGADSHYHVVAAGTINTSSAYQFNWTFGTAGTKTFRTIVPGGPDNVAGASSPVTISVALPPVASLPAAPGN